MKIFVVNGAPGAGKTTFEKMCKQLYSEVNTYVLSSVDIVKEIARKYCDWNGEKTPKDRKFLSDLKDLLTEYNDIPFKVIERQIQQIRNEYEYYGMTTKNALVFIDCREPKEIKKLCERLGAKSVYIKRPDAEGVAASNHADANVQNYEYDFIIPNTRQLYEFAFQVMLFLDNNGFNSKSIKQVDLFGNIKTLD